MDWSSEFPGLRASTYLNSCSHGLLPRRTRAAIEAHLAVWERGPDWDAWVASVEAARRGFARLIGAREDEVAVQANASAGIGAVMNALQPGARSRLVTMEPDFPTAPFLAQRQRERGFSHEHVRAEGGTVPLERWARALDASTALACVPAVASFNGWRLDVGAFAQAAHAKGVPLLVDAFQACGTYPFDVRRDDVDFLVSGVYKWLLAPTGLAFLYVRRDRHHLLPTTSGWMAAREPYAFDPMDELAPDARRFQTGSPPLLGAPAAAASLRLIEEVGVAAIEQHNGRLVERVRDAAGARGWEVLTPDQPGARSSIVTFRVPDLPRALAACAAGGVMVSPRLGGIRVSPHFYSSEADVDRLFEVLDKAR